MPHKLMCLALVLVTGLLFLVTSCLGPRGEPARGQLSAGTRLELPAREGPPTPTLIRPDFVLNVSPAEGSVIPLELYEADLTEEYFEETGILALGALRDARLGYDSTVCVYFDLGPLVHPEDDFSEVGRVIERSQLDVDNRILTNVVDVSYYPDLYIKGSARYGGPTAFCWQADLETGTHQATFRFFQTSGNVKEYTWEFTVAEDAQTGKT